MLSFERDYWQRGIVRVAGVDEAGRGPLAGTVVAACVLLPCRDIPELDGLTDSKKLSAAKREHFYPLIFDVALAVGIGEASPLEIDQINILQATFLAMRRAISQVPDLQFILVDGNRAIKTLEIPQQTIVKGDALSLSIAAASVIAKVTRDRQMEALDLQFPGYGFKKHKGYGTALHYQALADLGPTVHHRRTFLPTEIA